MHVNVVFPSSDSPMTIITAGTDCGPTLLIAPSMTTGRRWSRRLNVAPDAYIATPRNIHNPWLHSWVPTCLIIVAADHITLTQDQADYLLSLFARAGMTDEQRASVADAIAKITEETL